MAVILLTAAALIAEVVVVLVLWRLLGEHMWSASALFPLGAFAAVFLAVLPASVAISSLARVIVIAVVVAPVPVTTILKGVHSGKRQADSRASPNDRTGAARP